MNLKTGDKVRVKMYDKHNMPQGWVHGMLSLCGSIVEIKWADKKGNYVQIKDHNWAFYIDDFEEIPIIKMEDELFVI